MTSTRHVNFAGQHLTIQYPADLSEMIDFLYEHTDSHASGEPDTRLMISQKGGDYVISKDGEQLYRNPNKANLATALLRKTIYYLIDTNDSGLALHAAALSRGGKGIALPGPSGSGKTTLSTWLATRGFNYLTDEFVFMESESRIIQGFTRPPNVKVRGIEVLDTYLEAGGHSEGTMRGGEVAIMPTHLFNPDNQPEQVQLSLLVFPTYQKGSDLQLEKLSKARAGMKLMGSLVNARNLNGHGFEAAASLVRDVPSYNLLYGGFHQLESSGELDRAIDSTIGTRSDREAG